MDSRKSFSRAAGCFLVNCCLVALLLLAISLVSGCVLFPKKPTPPQIVVKSKTELAVMELREDWLKECAGLGPVPENSIGDLLQDSTDAMVLLATCLERHNSLARYLRPIVEAERKR